jgi:2-hydroxy-4-carboxymuconate semialdehyde hemiacetal dehydrogenase
MKKIKAALAGAGAFGIKHLEAIQQIANVELVSLVSEDLGKTQDIARRYGIGHATDQFAETLAMPVVEAVILCTPTPLHAAQAMACLQAGKHVLVEIPMADNWQDTQALVALAESSQLVAMCGHTRRFNPSINGCTKRFRRANSIFNNWMCRRIFSGAVISTP